MLNRCTKLTGVHALSRTNYRPTIQMAHLDNVAVLTCVSRRSQKDSFDELMEDSGRRQQCFHDHQSFEQDAFASFLAILNVCAKINCLFYYRESRQLPLLPYDTAHGCDSLMPPLEPNSAKPPPGTKLRKPAQLIRISVIPVHGPFKADHFGVTRRPASPLHTGTRGRPRSQNGLPSSIKSDHVNAAIRTYSYKCTQTH